jgi:uncharacterized membrane protein YeiH
MVVLSRWPGAPGASAICGAAVGGGLLVDLIAGRPVEVVHRGPWNATAALVGASVYALAAGLGAPTGINQAAAFVVVVAMRLGALRWGLQPPLPADLGQKLTPRSRQADNEPPPTGAEDDPQ